MEKECLQCKKIILKRKTCSLSDWEKRVRFCSRKCFDASRRGKPSCSPTTTFKKGYSNTIPFEKRKRGAENSNWKGGQVMLQCKICDSIFAVDPYRKTAKTCSKECDLTYRHSPEWRKCLSEIHKRRVEMRLHNCYRGGITPINNAIRHGSEYKIWRESIFKRDDYICQICKQKGGLLQADHIKQFAYYPKLRFEVGNGRTLCEKCHFETNTWGKRLSRL